MIDRRAHTGHLTLPRDSAALALTTAAVLAVALVNTDSLVERSFASALGDAAATPPARMASAGGVSGSEDFWLRGNRLPGTAPASWSKPPAVGGERITITAGGREVVLEVVDVRPLLADRDVHPAVTRIDTAEPSSPFLVVTCREIGEAADTRPIRFVVEPSTALPWRSLATPAHAL